MQWIEKIDVIKKTFSNDEFSIPMVDRKSILRQIENQFIARPKNYYFSNDFQGTFCDWWANLRLNKTSIIPQDKKTWTTLDAMIENQRSFWFAVEFTGHIEVYKARKPAIMALMNIGRTWCNTFHIIDLRYKKMKSIKFDKTELIIKDQEK